MTTFSDDFVRIRVAFGMPVEYTLSELGLEWPPPLRLGVALFVDGGDGRRLDVYDVDERQPGPDDLVYHRVSCSDMDDERRADTIAVARGSFYVLGVVSEARL